jgi:hypothetical protein
MDERHDRRDSGPHRDRYRRGDERGIPDGLLLGLLGFLLGLTLLVWTATGLAGVMAHGIWPKGVTFGHTPSAMRALASKPQDLPAAWPQTPAAELSGYGLFWGLAIGELMVLVVGTVFALGTVARWRAVRARARVAGESQEPSGQVPRDSYAKRAQKPDGRNPSPAPVEQGSWDPHANHGNGAAESAPTADSGTAAGPHTGAASSASLTKQGPQDPLRQPRVPQFAGQGPTGSAGTPAVHDATATTNPDAARPNPLADQGAGSPGPHGIHTTVPAPRAPRLLYGDPATRRPATVQAVLEAAGPALVVTSDPTVWAETKDARAKLGPVLVYDPGHFCDTPARLHWSPTARCEDATIAAARAAALLAPVRPRTLLDATMADTAETLLRCWLHGAAIDGRPFKQLHRWAQGSGTQDAVRILRTHPKAAAGLAGLLESALTAHPERREIAQQLVIRALSTLSSVHVREACTANRADSLILESFINEGGTLYVVGEPIEDPRTHPGAMPLLTALASDVVEHGRRMAARSSDGRLDPPLTLVLDDVAAVAPLPRLPELLTNGHEQGLPTLVLLRSAEQARARWPQPLPQ